MKKKLTSLALCGLLFTASLTQMACGNATTLARIGSGFQQATLGFKAEVQSLQAAGLLTPQKFAALNRRADGAIVAANALRAYLDSLPGVNASNKAEIIGKIGEATSLVAAILQNPDVTGLPPGNTVVKILTFASITLQNAAIVVAAINVSTAGTGGAALSAGVPLSSIVVKHPPVPKGVENYFKK